MCTIFFFLSTSFSFAAYDVSDSYELRHVNQENIEQHKAYITRTVRMHKWMRVGCVVGSVAACSYVAYQFLRPSGAEIKISLDSESMDISPEISVVERFGNAEKRIAVLEKILAAEQPKSWCGWFKQKASSVGNWVAFSAAVSVLQRMYGRVFHDDSMKWFVENRTGLNQLAEVMGRYAKKLSEEKKELTEDELSYYRETLAGTCQFLIHQIELVAGYMEHSLERFEKRGAVIKPNALLQVSHLITITNDFIDSMQKLLPAKQPDCEESIKKLFDVAGQFSSDLARQVNCFSGIEHGIEWTLTHN